MLFVFVAVVEVEVVCDGGLFGARVGRRRDFRRALGDRVGDAAASAGAEAQAAERAPPSDQRAASAPRAPAGAGEDRRRRVGVGGAHRLIDAAGGRSHPTPARGSSGPMRLPQVGQSLRSFWACCSHQGQKRRFSTAHGSRELDGASGRTLADDLERLAGFAVEVDLLGLGLDQDLPAGGGVAQAIALSRCSCAGRLYRRRACRARRARVGWRRVRILIFHGYLLGGTGSNVYNARLADGARRGSATRCTCSARSAIRERARVRRRGRRLGRRHADAVRGLARRASGPRRPAAAADAASSTARTSAACCRCTWPTATRGSRRARSPTAAMRRSPATSTRTSRRCAEVLALARPQLALANHLVMGPVILARALAGEVPYAVKVHGSALEYTVKPQPERFLGLAREGVAGASAVLVGSRHTAASLWQALGETRARASARGSARRASTSQRFAPREPAAAAGGRARAGGAPAARRPADGEARAGAGRGRLRPRRRRGGGGARAARPRSATRSSRSSAS